ncbi:hypothetical protein GGS23DRAFT_578440 [Durotheca rogersii]|uniref:uncharacterized protein n=1 Tax=Durotheca rogersii TaxID=419775 RepID=UPI00222126CB|nr:uncharacterized protein GGS23DRAFT_578440 [Durotheca rogersii]KAI5861032.1 hypothetical protein GGS23DRAFT_578440 [Durotheca rogersii]
MSAATALPSATMSVFMDKTKADDDNVSEQVRLEDQHETVIYAMGKALYAPVDLSKSGLRILDSGCANGRWIKDLQAAAWPAQHEYVGTDVVSSLYPAPAPAGTRFADQSIKEAFPAAWAGTFDVVHQRLVMAAAAPERAPGWVVRSLAGLLRPGGWLQMVEVATAPPLPRNGPAQADYLAMLDTLYAKLYGGTPLDRPNLMGRLPDEMRGAGLAHVAHREVLVPYGAAVADPRVRERSLRTAVAGVPNFLSVLRKMPPEVWRPEWDDLESRLYTELKETGGYARYIVCWGQK